MRKYFLSLVAMAAMILLSGCNKNEDFYISDNGDMVTFNIATPEMGTRAISDGTTVSTLYVAVYQGGVYRPALTESDGYDINNKTATVSLPLVTGVTYDIVFWAQAEGAPYTFNAAEGIVSVDYTGVTANNENLDAFYANRLEYEVKGPKTETVELTRPFAQLNVATLDYELAKNSGIDITKTAIEVEGVYTSFRLLNEFGAVIGEPSDAIELDFETIPTETLVVNGDSYKWLSMNYLLVNDKTNIRAKMTTKNENGTVTLTREWHNIPVQRNYRTNILGNILTTTTDFNVVIDEEFAGEQPGTAEEKLHLAAQVGGTFVLSENIVLTKPLVVSGEMVLDLNGKTLSQRKECTGSYSMILNEGSLTIKDGVGNGKISFEDLGDGGSQSFGSYVIENRGILVINGGIIEHLGTTKNLNAHNTNIPVQNYTGKVIVNDGRLVSKDFRSLRDFTAGGEIVINGGIFEGQVWMQGLGNGTTSLTITGGNFAPLEGYDRSSVYLANETNVINLSITGGNFATKIGCADPSKDGVKGSVTGGVYGANDNLNDLIADGYKVIEKDGKYYVVENDVNAVATTPDELSEAINNDQNVVLVNDVTSTTILTVNNGTIVDGKGNTINFNGVDPYESAMIVRGGTLQNIVVTGAYRALGTGGSGSYPMTGDAYFKNVTTEGATYGFNISNGNGHKLFVEDCTIGDWNSYSGLSSAEFTNCTFIAQGNYKAAQRIYGDVTFTYRNCTFPVEDPYDYEGYYIDGKNGKPTIIFENCKLSDGTLITGDVLKDKNYFKCSSISYKIKNN